MSINRLKGAAQRGAAQNYDPKKHTLKPAESNLTYAWRNFTNNPFVQDAAKVASILAPIPPIFRLGKLKKLAGAFGNAPKQYHKLAGGKGVTTNKKAAEVINREVPVVGQPGVTTTVNDATTRSVSYVNPRISMTAAERKAAGY